MPMISHPANPDFAAAFQPFARHELLDARLAPTPPAGPPGLPGMKALVDALERRLAIERASRKQAQDALARANAELDAARAELGRLSAQQDEVFQRRTAELRRARDEALAASNAKSAFVANMSHEIRTPLTSIIGFAELLLQEEHDPGIDKTDCVHTIIRNGRHLLEVINDILDLAKIETQQMDLERVDLPLPVLLRDLNVLVAPRAEEKSLQFDVQPQLPLPATLRCDPVRLKQILINFCTNAIKFTPRGSVTVELRYARDERRMTFSVRDTGIGMSTSQVHKLFQPFSQADLSTTRKFGGTGLGLYISRQLAAMLGGGIRVESELGRGSTFHLDLLAARRWARARNAHDGGRPHRLRPQRFCDHLGVGTEARRHGALAEDGVDNQRLLSAYLKQAGLESDHRVQRA